MVRGLRLRSAPLEISGAALCHEGKVGRAVPTSGPPISERTEKGPRTEVSRRRTGARFHKTGEAEDRHNAAPETKSFVSNAVHFSCTSSLHSEAEHGLKVARHGVERMYLGEEDLRPEAVTQKRRQLHSRDLPPRRH